MEYWPLPHVRLKLPAACREAMGLAKRVSKNSKGQCVYCRRMMLCIQQTLDVCGYFGAEDVCFDIIVGAEKGGESSQSHIFGAFACILPRWTTGLLLYRRN